MICATVLTPPENNYKGVQKVRYLSEQARIALDQCAKKQNLDHITWLQSPGGAPQVSQGYYWSISHKSTLVGAVISDEPIGIDIEILKPRKNKGLWDRVATTSEWNIIGERNWNTFFHLWTAKEATLKANSKGIGYLENCKLLEATPKKLTMQFKNNKWYVQQQIYQNHVIAISYQQEKDIEIFMC